MNYAGRGPCHHQHSAQGTQLVCGPPILSLACLPPQLILGTTKEYVHENLSLYTSDIVADHLTGITLGKTLAHLDQTPALEAAGRKPRKNRLFHVSHQACCPVACYPRKHSCQSKLSYRNLRLLLIGTIKAIVVEATSDGIHLRHGVWAFCRSRGKPHRGAAGRSAGPLEVSAPR